MGNLIETIVGSAKLKGVADAMKIGGMVDLLSADGPYTLLCPHDEAFAQVPRSLLNSILENKEELAKVIKYHIIRGSLTSRELAQKLKNKESLEVETMEGHRLAFRYSGTLKHHFTVNESSIVSADIRADNGIIHIIDKVLFISPEE